MGSLWLNYQPLIKSAAGFYQNHKNSVAFDRIRTLIFLLGIH